MYPTPEVIEQNMVYKIVRAPTQDHGAPQRPYLAPDEAVQHQCYRCPYGTWTGTKFVCGWADGCVAGERS